MKNILWKFVLVGGLFVALPAWAQAEDTVQHVSAQALEECQQGRAATVNEIRQQHFRRAEALAERAITLNDQYPDAHFALFCGLGEQMREGNKIFFSFSGYRRMMAALDQTLALDPHHLDALSSKGTLLVELPGLFGGDPEKGEQMLEEVIQREPLAINARLVVARLCEERGEHQRALELAEKALSLARAQNREDLIPEAQSTLRDIQNVQSEKRWVLF